MHPHRAPSALIACALGCVLSGASAQNSPRSPDMCKKDARFRAQDFSIGQWAVYRGTTKVADVTMEPILNACAIRQTWTVTPGKMGNVSGLFSYSPILNGWLYAFTTDYANNNYFVGHEVKEGEILYETKVNLPNGSTRLRRWTLSLEADGSLEEKSVASADGGTTWTDEYVFSWKKRHQ